MRNIFLILSLLIFSCDEEEVDIDIHPLVGEWALIQSVFSFTLDSSPPLECDGQESHSTVVENAEKYQEYIMTINSDNTGTSSVICKEEQSLTDCLNQPVYDDDCECRNSSGNFEWSVSENIITGWEPNDPSDTESRNFSITGNVLTIEHGSQQNCGIEKIESTYTKQ